MTFLKGIQVSQLKVIFHHWVERVKSVLGHDGDYYRKQVIS
jgi:hypothetical protein